MQRILYFAGFTYIALCGAILFRHVVELRLAAVPPELRVPDPSPAAPARTTGEQWFARMKPYCNPVEVEVNARYTPPPATSEGAGYAAACYALAGKVERSRQIVESMPPGDRSRAAEVLFNVAHPVADAGDDKASGPMMELVLEYWPNNYMALYHAGMSEFTLGQTALAEMHLRAFLQMYTVSDGFNQNAQQALRTIERASASGRDAPRPAAEREPARP